MPLFVTCTSRPSGNALKDKGKPIAFDTSNKHIYIYRSDGSDGETTTFTFHGDRLSTKGAGGNIGKTLNITSSSLSDRQLEIFKDITVRDHEITKSHTTLTVSKETSVTHSGTKGNGATISPANGGSASFVVGFSSGGTNGHALTYSVETLTINKETAISFTGTKNPAEVVLNPNTGGGTTKVITGIEKGGTNGHAISFTYTDLKTQQVGDGVFTVKCNSNNIQQFSANAASGKTVTFKNGSEITLSSDTTNAAITVNHNEVAGSERASGFYKFSYNTYGHITSSTEVTKSDITLLGIPGSNTHAVDHAFTISSSAIKKFKIALSNSNAAGSGIATNAYFNLNAGDNIVITYRDQDVAIAAQDTRYSAGSCLSLSGTTFNHNSAFTSGGTKIIDLASDQYGQLNFGDDTVIPDQFYVDDYGHVRCNHKEIKMPKLTISSNNPTLNWGTTSTIGSFSGSVSSEFKVTMPSNPNTNYTYKFIIQANGHEVTHFKQNENCTFNIISGNKINITGGSDKITINHDTVSHTTPTEATTTDISTSEKIVVVGVGVDSYGHVSNITSAKIKSTNTQYREGTKISISGTTINHATNSISGEKAGLFKSITLDTTGHMTSYAQTSAQIDDIVKCSSLPANASSHTNTLYLVTG